MTLSDSAADSRNLTSVVIVTFNAADDIAECIASFQGASHVEIVVVDNSSTDGTPQLVEGLKRAGAVDVVVLSTQNHGFAKAVNTGIAKSSGRDILLLNPDARISATALELLRDAVDDDPELGIVAPVVLNGPGVAVMSAGEQPTLWPLFTHYSGLARAFPTVRAFRGRHLYLKHHANVDQDVGWVSGACMYISRRAMDRVGLLSERWFMYGEDIDYCHRVREAGLAVRALAGARAEHSLGASVNSPSQAAASGTTPATSTMWARNTFDYYCHTFSPGWFRRFTWRAIFSGGLYARSFALWLLSLPTKTQRQNRGARARQLRGHARAVWNGRGANPE